MDAEAGFKLAKDSFHNIVAPNHEIGEWKADVAFTEVAHRAGKSALAFQAGCVIGQWLEAIEAERKRLNQ